MSHSNRSRKILDLVLENPSQQAGTSSSSNFFVGEPKIPTVNISKSIGDGNGNSSQCPITSSVESGENQMTFSVIQQDNHSPENILKEDSDDSVADKDYVPSDESSDNSIIANKNGVISHNNQFSLVPYSDSETELEDMVGGNGESNNDKKKKSSYTRATIKHNRNRGLEYTNRKGKIVEARTVKPLQPCRKKCANKINFEEQEQIFKEYWNLADYNKRVLYLAQLIFQAPKKTVRIRNTGQAPKPRSMNYIYYVKFRGVLVELCKGCFKKTFCESDKFLRTVIKKSVAGISGVTSSDQRGSSTPPSKISEERNKLILDHINSYPAYESHYSRRHTSRKYLPIGLNLTLIYQMYKEKVSQPASRSHFTKIFESTGMKFKKPSLDTCNTCDTLSMKIKLAGPDEKEMVQQQLDIHHADADFAYEAKSKDKENSNNESLTLTFDLQQCLPTPHLTTNVVFYKRLLWTFNLTVCGSKGKTTCYMWHEGEGGRGANQIASCLSDYLLSLSPEIKTVTLYSDTCGGQNKNSHMAAMFLYVAQMRPSLIIHHKFLVPGHTHMECDVIHAQIEKRKKMAANNLHVPRDWYNLVRNCSKNDTITVKVMHHSDFLDFSKLLKGPLQLRHFDINGSKFVWRDVKWFSYGTDEGNVKYKTSLKQEDPFKCISFCRRGKSKVPLQPERCYTGPLSISREKKKDLLSILNLIDSECHQFYENLPDGNNVTDADYVCDSDDSV